MLLDAEPLDDIYTLHRGVSESGMQMPPDVVRRLHKCEVKK